MKKVLHLHNMGGTVNFSSEREGGHGELCIWDLGSLEAVRHRQLWWDYGLKYGGHFFERSPTTCIWALTETLGKKAIKYLEEVQSGSIFPATTPCGFV